MLTNTSNFVSWEKKKSYDMIDRIKARFLFMLFGDFLIMSINISSLRSYDEMIRILKATI